MNSINRTDFQMVTSLIKGSQMAPDFLSHGILLNFFQIFILSSSLWMLLLLLLSRPGILQARTLEWVAISFSKSLDAGMHKFKDSL